MFGAPWQVKKLNSSYRYNVRMSQEKDFIPRLSPTWRKSPPVCHTDSTAWWARYNYSCAVFSLHIATELLHLTRTKMHSDNHNIVATFLPDKIVFKCMNINCLTVLFWGSCCAQKAFGYTVNSFDIVSAKPRNPCSLHLFFIFDTESERR